MATISRRFRSYFHWIPGKKIVHFVEFGWLLDKFRLKHTFVVPFQKYQLILLNLSRKIAWRKIAVFLLNSWEIPLILLLPSSFFFSWGCKKKLRHRVAGALSTLEIIKTKAKCNQNLWKIAGFPALLFKDRFRSISLYPDLISTFLQYFLLSYE